MFTTKKLSIGFLLIAAGCLVAGAFLPWWTGDLASGRFQIDLRKMTLCFEGLCRDRALTGADGSAQGWARLGSSVFAASFVSIFLLLVSTVESLKAKQHFVTYWLTGAVAMFTGLLAILFIIANPSSGEWVPSYGLASTIAGSFVGALAISVVARSIRHS